MAVPLRLESQGRTSFLVRPLPFGISPAHGAVDAILAAITSGDLKVAEGICRAHLQATPVATDLLGLLGVCLWQQGDRDQALVAFRRLARLCPGDADHRENYATALQATGNIAAAVEAAEAAVLVVPDDAERLAHLGRLQLENGNPIAARETLLRAFGRAPESPVIRIDAARACCACRDHRAENLLRPWRAWLPLDDGLQFDLACVLSQLGKANESIEVLEDLLRRSATHVCARLLLSSMYERVNQLDDAVSLLRDVIASGQVIAPELGCQVSLQQAQLAARRGDHAAARMILEQSGPRSDSDPVHWFALAAACDKLDDTVSAMRALGMAHSRQREELRALELPGAERGAHVLPGAGWRVGRQDYSTWPKLRAPEASQSPVFVVGFPRSGTTLLEQMLDAHPRLQSMDERPIFNTLANQLGNAGIRIPRDLGTLTQRDCDELRKGYLVTACSEVPRRWDAQLVDKNPMNMLWLPLLHRLFPNARIILAIRHPCDVILSGYMQNFRSTLLASAALTLERLARAYVESMACWLYHTNVFQPAVFVSRHEELVADAPAQTLRIAGFLGLDQPEAMLEFAACARAKGYIKTPSYTQVIESINRNGVGRWMRYRKYLEPVLPILEPMLEHWGYPAA